MRKNNTWRTIIIWVVLLASVFYFLPSTGISRPQWWPEKYFKKVNLGLDLQGGMHLILEVETDKITDGGNPSDAVDTALEIIRNRVDQFGVSEPQIQREGENRIIVQLPGIKDPKRAINLIGKTAQLAFHLVDDSGDVQKAVDGDVPDGDALMELVQVDRSTGREIRQWMLVTAEPKLTGAHLTSSQVKIGGQWNEPYVSIDLDKEGGRIFDRVTGANVNRRLAIVLDGVVKSAPNINERISGGSAMITGSFSMDEAKDLAIIMRAGALPAPVKIIGNWTVGSTLGQDSINKGISSSAIGLFSVIIFMLIYYKACGAVADCALIFNLIILVAALAMFGATLTLPGIAGIILTIGMAVDANVLIFERIREELQVGKTTRAAVDSGYDKAFITIVDANTTTLITAIILFQFGTGPVKGFAVTLSLGIIISMFTALVVTKAIFDFATANLGTKKLSI